MVNYLFVKCQTNQASVDPILGIYTSELGRCIQTYALSPWSKFYKFVQPCKCCYIAKLSEFHNLLHVVNVIYETGLVMCLYLFPHSYCRCGGVYSVNSIRPSPTLLDLSFHLLPTGRRCFIFDCPIHCQRT